MCNSQYVTRLAQQDIGSVNLDTRYEVGDDTSDTRLHSFYFLNF